SEENYEQLKKAIGRLHEGGFVFGDLRKPNILISRATGGVVLVDFDFCGKENEARYPVGIHTELCWATARIDPGAVMKKLHDNLMLNRLNPRMVG
ncbi:hypothetical protein BDY19DRAFT_746482, partial [Irpex rosettiformis]